MGLETGTYISDLVITNPLGSDPKSTADDHLRLIKSCLKTTFPNVTGAVTKTHTELNSVTDRGLIGGQTWTGTHNFPATTYGVTATLGDSSLKFATTEFVANTAFSSALPAQLGNSGKYLTTNGTTASWAEVFPSLTGNSLKHLRVNAGETATEWVADVASLILIASVTPTVSSTIDFLSTFSSTYDNYLIIGNGLTVGTDDLLRVRLATGGTADTTSKYFVSPFSSSSPVTASATSAILLSTLTSAGKGGSFVMWINNVNDTANLKTINSRGISQSAATPEFTLYENDTVYNNAAAVSGFRIYTSAGNNFAATGKIYVYGVRKV